MLPLTEEKHGVAKLLMGCSFVTNGGNELPKCPTLTHEDRNDGVQSNTPLPKYSVIFFNVVPFRCCKSIMLQNFVVSRLGKENSKSREELIEIAQKNHQLNKRILEPEKVPLQIDAWSLHGNITPMTGCEWQHDGYYHHLKNNMCTMSNSIIRKIWPKGNESNRNRAKQLIQCSSIVSPSL